MTSPAPRPTLILIAGPNGAGKTTFYETVLKSRVKAPFINADLIQRDELKDASPEAAYEAARIAAERRDDCLRSLQSFVTETVFSHPSKLKMLQDARKAGFRIMAFHLHLQTPDLAVARVAARVEEGGHPVPEKKILDRYERNQRLIRMAMLMADRGAIYDASRLNQPPLLLAQAMSGRIERVVQTAPDWFASLYGDVSTPPSEE